ncbi:putative efflux pump membrane fusion protein [mine drainage metagenome]|uniref:Putative efflux pump membrane fusion protein n=1 Tax=mine drainage metagenome TaxID=410659 RepID=A0A1J5RZE3_9ZZZZ
MIRRFPKIPRGWVPPLAAGLAWLGAIVPLVRGVEPGCVEAVSAMAAPSATAYAQVEPLALVPLIASATGIVSKLRVLPGDRVIPGEVIARLTGPEFTATWAAARGAVASARADETGAEQALALRRRQAADHLATRQDVLQAEAALAGAKAALDRALAEADAVRAAGAIEAPVPGVVLAVDTADGARVATGQALLTIQPAGRIWLRADWYANSGISVHPGMQGRFAPSSGGPDIPVEVRAVFGVRTPGGGEALGLEATKPGVEWKSGDAGILTLQGAPRPMISVPTRALILDRGHWWVLVRTAGKDHPVAVQPAWSSGWNTFLATGPAAGTQIVVENAYLEYHRGIADRYQPPD